MNADIHETIVAPSTPPGRSALAVVRLSGSEARRILGRLSADCDGDLEARRPRLVTLLDVDEQPLDNALITYFPGPRSYTGEDVIEISCHGSPVVTQRILEGCLARGARLAEPGEFTLRAFLHGKMDLTQAEAVRDLIESQTAFQAQVAREQLEGKLSKKLQPARHELIEIASHLETALEFVEDDVAPETRVQLSKRLVTVRDQLCDLEASYEVGRIIHDGLTVVLAGKPNSGKSSVFNQLVECERAIVTDVPGTTRDPLREAIDLRGVPVLLVDTAGIRESAESVERAGIARSLEHVSEADLILFVVDESRRYSDEDEFIWRNVGCLQMISVSALLGENVDELVEGIVKHGLPEAEKGERASVTNARQKRCLEEAHSWLERAGEALAGGMSEEFVVHDLRKGLESLGRITGETTTEDILAGIFSSFCIGK
jgi:tRNA modification GTPase